MPHSDANKPLVVITGSSGLIGTRISQVLADDYCVVGLDVKEPRDARGVFIACDLTKDDSTRQALAEVRARHGSRIASVVHLAAYYDFSGEPSPRYEQLTVKGTERLLNELKSFDTVEQLIFSSTLLVMKPAEEGEILDETSPVEVQWDYPQSKIVTERLLQQRHGHIPVVVLRIAGVYDDACHSIPLAQQISRIYEKNLESYLFPGDPSHGQAFVHLDDVADCVRKTIEKRSMLGNYEVFLIGEPDVMSYEELQDQIGTLIHRKEWPTIRIPAPVAKLGAWVKEKLPGEDPFIKPWMVDLADDSYPVSIALARDRLGWEPRRRLRDTLQLMVGRLLENPQRWYEEHELGEPPAEQAPA